MADASQMQPGSRPLAASLAALAIACVATAQDYCPPASPVEPPQAQLCENGSVVALIGSLPPHAIGLVTAGLNTARIGALHGHGESAAPTRAEELRISHVRQLGRYPNMLVFRLANGLATADALRDLRPKLEAAVGSLLRQQDLGAKPAVVLEPSVRLQARGAALPDDYDPDKQWGLERIHVAAAWDALAVADNPLPITVAVIDTGVSPVKDELEGDLFALDSAKLPLSADYTDGAAAGAPGLDTDGHGTGVASVIAARTNNGTGMTGVAWRGPGFASIARLMPIRVMITRTDTPFGFQPTANADKCTHSLLEALPYAVDPGHSVPDSFWNLDPSLALPTEQYAPPDGARVVNLSLGFKRCSRFVGRALDQLARSFKKVLFVAALPDDIEDMGLVADYPFSYRLDNVMSVTAADSASKLTNAYGADVDVIAPGSAIEALNLDGISPHPLEGTSFAAPLVSGAAALLESLAPDWSYSDIREYLARSRDRAQCGSKQYHAVKCKNHRNNEQSICYCTNTGLLDLQAATAPPIDSLNVSKSTAWKVGAKKTVSWKRTFAAQRCNRIDLELLFDNGESTRLATGVNVDDEEATVSQVPELPASLASLASVPARVSIQCSDSPYRLRSETFSVESP